MNISKIIDNLQGVLDNFTPQTFIYDLLSAYGRSPATIARLQNGNLNLSKKSDEIIWKKNLYFKRVKKDLTLTLEEVSHSTQINKHSPRFLIISDDETLLAVDTQTIDKLDIPIEELPENFDFFLPLSGIEKATIYKENEADIKAAERMAKIYEEICKLNPNMAAKLNDAIALNAFLSRLLFCYFAESTGIFTKNQFTESIIRYTKEDGSDLHKFFEELFASLNRNKWTNCPKYLKNFPYVNGGLFKNQYKIPKFSQRLRKMIIDSGKLNWSRINPDIFGSMIQAVIDPAQRSSLGMHYTSTSNIMKVIGPLFLDGLYDELKNCKKNKRKLEKLYTRIGNIKIFDPACGSGNFLIVAYKELRQFEIELLKEMESLGRHPTFLSQIHLSQFYGIEIDEFACEIAKLSLWLAEHQMNMVFEKTFGKSIPSLPLKEGGNIKAANAIKVNWDEICPKQSNSEIYILGNPPYQGARKQTPSQKKDVAFSLLEVKNCNNLDYVSCWVYKAAQYISENDAKAAFVTTNSITQGAQVSILWPKIFDMGVEIGFAHTSFKWANNAKNNAGVACIIIGLRKNSKEPKFLFTDKSKILVENINGYLANFKNVEITSRSNPISCLPEITFGSMPNDKGHLLLSKEEKEKLIKNYPKARKFIRKLVGGEEFLYNIEKYCLWIQEDKLKEALTIEPIKERINKVKKYRAGNTRIATKKLADYPYRFAEVRHQEQNYILIPSTTSEKREYIPIGLFPHSTIAKNSSHLIYKADHLVFGFLSSKMHNLWTRAIAGRLEMRIIYSAEICYNNFPIPNLSTKQEKLIKLHVSNIIEEREEHPEKTIAELYDPKKMPAGLRKAHHNLDAIIEDCYRSQPFLDDEERLAHLFQLYEKLIQVEVKGKKRA